MVAPMTCDKTSKNRTIQIY